LTLKIKDEIEVLDQLPSKNEIKLSYQKSSRIFLEQQRKKKEDVSLGFFYVPICFTEYIWPEH
jgi:hypothetical protein